MKKQIDDVLSKTKEWFEVAVPNPTLDKQRVQMGVHLEEVSEMLDSIDSEVPGDYREYIYNAILCLRTLSNALKTEKPFQVVVLSREELLDSLCDQIVTATGVAHMYGLDLIGALKEVNRSNFSKFEDGRAVFNEHGKIRKGVNYTKPDLTPFVGSDPVQ